MVNEILETPAGELVQEFWCEDCKERHTGSVLGGPVESSRSAQESSREVRSERR